MNYVKRLIRAASGMILCGCGIFLMIRTQIGVQPWDALCQGLADIFGLKFGMMSLLMSLAIIGCDSLLHERIGVGTLLDAFLVGKTVDLLSYYEIVKAPTSVGTRVLMLLCGLAMQSYGQGIYMQAGLGCGAKDALLVGLGRSMPRIPIGAVNVGLLTVVTAISLVLHGPIGIGTVICTFCNGLLMQVIFHIMHFQPCSVQHESIAQSLHTICAAGKKMLIRKHQKV